MTNKAKIIRHASITVFAAAVMLVVASVCSAQRDPFKKADWATPKNPAATTAKKPGTPAAPVNYGPPPIDARIDYYKRIREQAVAAGRPVPKVTSVLTLAEMTVAGIFKTPRGWAAMVQATPINLSYTVFPGEKFFDGQLVAIEENRLIFKKVTKVGEGKFVASVENKPLRQYTVREQATGTAPTGASGNTGKEEKVVAEANQPALQPTAADGSAAAAPKTAKVKQPTNPFLSPLDEMNAQPDKKDDKGSKKSTKVARNGQ